MPAEAENAAGPSILVVDDEVSLTRLVGRALKGKFDVTVTNDAREALALIEGGARYQVVLCDLMMPVLNGMDLYEKVLAVAPEQARKFIFMTGGAFTARAQEFFTEVGPARLEKPFSMDALLTAVRINVNGA